jgi:hypothetical protein
MRTIYSSSHFGCHIKRKVKMNKFMMILGLAATVALVGCNKDKAPETGATTGEHLENAATQASHDVEHATSDAAAKIDAATDNAVAKIDAAADHAAATTEHAADKAEAATRDAAHDAAASVEKTAQDVKKGIALIDVDQKIPLIKSGIFLLGR